MQIRRKNQVIPSFPESRSLREGQDDQNVWTVGMDLRFTKYNKTSDHHMNKQKTVDWQAVRLS